MDRCVKAVKAKDGGKNAYAVCFSSIVGKGVSDAAAKAKKGGK
jgi:hypothetical protein